MDNYLESLKIGNNLQVDKWFLMQHPWPIFSIVIAYLAFVATGPRLMKNRAPFQMDRLILIYNALQVFYSVMLCYKALNAKLFEDGILYAGCRYPAMFKSMTMSDIGWYYSMAKVMELLDTVFFILRKKENQVTFLHVYHHASTAIYAWSYTKYAAEGQAVYFVLLNSGVHVFMYTYYLLSGLGPEVQRYLWWKKYVTVVQLIQFVEILKYIVVTQFSSFCKPQPGFTAFMFLNSLLFLNLFSRFYLKSYRKKFGFQELQTCNQYGNGYLKLNVCNGLNKDKNA